MLCSSSATRSLPRTAEAARPPVKARRDAGKGERRVGWAGWGGVGCGRWGEGDRRAPAPDAARAAARGGAGGGARLLAHRSVAASASAAACRRACSAAISS